MPVPCPDAEDGLLIVNLGKNMDFWTGGRFKATLHRVVNKIEKPRLSVPFFYEPNMDAVIRPIIHQNCGEEKSNEMKKYIKEKFGKAFITPADLFFERLNNANNTNFDP
jgi:isopenicillin N synthase-like dioxygenase